MKRINKTPCLPNGDGTNTPWRVYAAIWLTLCSALIIAAARGDLWLDEIWSFLFARNARSVSDLFVFFHHDNNHLLNTVFLYLVGEQKTLFVYRLLAILSGIGSVFLVGHIAKKDWGYPEALCAIVLTGTSYPLLLYFSEARGYAPAIFFALASYVALRYNLRDFKLWRLVLFWVTSILGILSHATFIMLTMAFVSGGLADAVYAAVSFRQKALRFLAHHVPPLVFFAWWYIFYLKGMTIGGGPIYTMRAVIGQAAALLLGFPDAPGFREAAIGLALVLTALGANSLRRERDMQATFFSFALVCSPALLLILSHPKYLYFRYFIICFPFFYLLLSHLICKCYRLCPTRRLWPLFAVLLILSAGQIPRDYLLLKLGRGAYSAALAYISGNPPEGVKRIGSDNDYRNRMLFNFYAPRVAGGASLRYIERAKWRDESPDWILVHSQDVSYLPLEKLVAVGIGEYSLVNTFRFSGVSGWNWFLYRSRTFENLTGKK